MGRFGDYEKDRESRTPLDNLAEDIEPREGRLSGGGRHAGIFSVSQAGLWLLGAISIVVLALMITSTVMLWQIADRTGSDDNGGTKVAQSAEPPPLPEDEVKRGTSSKELLDEFDQLGADLSRPVSSLNGQIANTNEVFGAVSNDLNQLVKSAGDLSGAQGTLEEVAKSTKQLSSVDKSLQGLNKDFGTFSDVSTNTEQMNINMGKMIGKLDTSNSHLGSLAALDAQMQKMNAQLGSLASMDAQMQQMNKSLQTFDSMNELVENMNGRMSRMLEIMEAFCESPLVTC